ncbi:hypothetical protein HDV00_001575 [Rhizophlyctis rosea]|nr:hypothetical protein HDV00_001575 [Rhizophlyctis rosea]
MAAIEERELRLDAFKGRPPPKFGNWFNERTDVAPRTTDYDKATIPRAIYNDPIEELLLREEGASGRKRKNNDVLNPLRKAGGLQAVAGARDPNSNSEAKITYEDEGTHTVILTDWGIDIINFEFVQPIRPIQKPRIACPTNEPVFNPARHKALPPSFSSTYRISTGMNMLAVTPVPVAKKAYQEAQLMLDGTKKELEKSVLRYQKRVPNPKPKPAVTKEPSVPKIQEAPPIEVARSVSVISEAAPISVEPIPPVVAEVLAKAPSVPKIDRSSERVSREDLPRGLSLATKAGPVAASTMTLSPEERDELEEETRRLYAAWGRDAIEEDEGSVKHVIDVTSAVSPAQGGENVSAITIAGQEVIVGVTDKQEPQAVISLERAPTEPDLHVEIASTSSVRVPIVAGDESVSPTDTAIVVTPADSHRKAHMATAAALASAAAASVAMREQRESATAPDAAEINPWAATSPTSPTEDIGGDAQAHTAKRIKARPASVVLKPSRHDLLAKETESAKHTASTVMLHAAVDDAVAGFANSLPADEPAVVSASRATSQFGPSPAAPSPASNIVSPSMDAETLPKTDSQPPAVTKHTGKFLNAMDMQKIQGPAPTASLTVSTATVNEGVISIYDLYADRSAADNLEEGGEEVEHAEPQHKLKEKRKSKLHLNLGGSTSSLASLFGKKKDKAKEKERKEQEELEKEKERERHEREKMEKEKEEERLEQLRIAQELEMEREKLEREKEEERRRLERERLEREERELQEREQKKRERMEQEERARITREEEILKEKERIELAMIALEKEKEREREQREKERQERETGMAREREQKQREEQQRQAELAELAARESMERAREIEMERERERKLKQEREAEERKERERQEQERLEAERIAREKEAERLQQERKRLEERLEAERLERERELERQRLERERLEAERAERAKEAERQRQEWERIEKEQLAEKERLKQERLQKEAEDLAKQKAAEVAAAAAAAAAAKPADRTPVPATVTWKDKKVDIKVEDFELYCTEPGKTKPYKHFFPMELRRVVSAVAKGDDVVVHACITRKGEKAGSKFKKIVYQFGEAGKSKAWADAIMELVYGGTFGQVTSKQVVVLVDKHEGKDAMKLVEKYMKPVWDSAGKPNDVKLVQYNEFSIMNALSTYDWQQLAHVVLTNPEFTPRLQQLLVRNQKTMNPALLPVEPDPVDAALAVLRANIGKSKKDAFHVTGFVPKREEGKIAGMFKAFK